MRVIMTSKIDVYHCIVGQPHYADKTRIANKRASPAYASQVNAILTGNRLAFHSAITDDYGLQTNVGTQNGYAGLISDEGPVPPMSSWEPAVLERKVNNNPKWTLSKTSKEMVVAAYAKRSVKATFSYGSSVTPIRQLGTIQVTGPSMTSLPWRESDMYPGYLALGNDNYLNVVASISYQVADIDTNVHPYGVGMSESKLSDAFLGIIRTEVDPAWVQESIAEANGKALDWLTTVAEAPKTIGSVVSALAKGAGLIKSFKRQRSDIIADHAKWLKALKKEIFDAINMLAKAKLRTLRNSLTRRLKRLNRELSREGQILVDKITSLWMQYRYEIMPVVYTIQGGIKASEEIKNQFFTVRDSTKMTINMPSLGSNWDWVGTNQECVIKLMIKFGYKTSGTSWLDDLDKVLSANIFLTAWELTPLSFVADWFVSVGDALSAAFGYSDTENVKRVATLSYKTDISGYYVERNTSAKVYIDYSGYERFIPDLSSYVGIYFRPNVNLKRMIDAFCLSWPLMKKALK